MERLRRSGHGADGLQARWSSFPFRFMVHDDPLPSPAKSSDDPPVTDLQPPVVHQSTDLLQGRTEVLIAHAGQTYRLRVTRSGKLILQK